MDVSAAGSQGSPRKGEAQSSEEQHELRLEAREQGHVTCHLATAATFRRERGRAGWKGVCLEDCKG